MTVNTSYYNNYSNYGSYGTSGTSKTTGIYDLLYSASNLSTTQTNSGGYSQSAQSFLLNAKSHSEDLKAALNDILGKNKSGISSFDNKTAESSDEEALAVKSVDSKKAASMSDIKVQIEQVATTQINGGTALKANEISGITTGAQRMDLKIGEKTYSVNYNISSADTNQKAQQKIADAINGRGLGVKASVSTDKEGNSMLTLESVATGVNKEGEVKFSITGDTGNAAMLTGIDKVTQSAQNAQYRVNDGYLRTSKSNDVDLGNGVSATLKAGSEGKTVSVSMGKDMSDAVKGVKDMVESYNSLIKLAGENSSDKRTASLHNNLLGVAKTYSESLKRIGVTVSGDGTLKIDEDKLQKSAEKGEFASASDLEKFFKSGGSGNFGFANRLEKISGDVASDPTKYVSSADIQSFNFTPNQVSRYNRYVNVSMMLDMFA